jgi:NMD protein affecting ribosome stability and mRNA decay
VKEFCPKCGDRVGPFVSGFCVKCFQERNTLVFLPEKIPVEYCSRCESVRVKGRWIPFSKDVLKEIVLSKIKSGEHELLGATVDLMDLSDSKFLAVVSFKVRAGSSVIEGNIKSALKLGKGICDSCMKASSDYFEAIIQIRRGNKPIPSLDQGVMRELHDFFDALHKKDSSARIVSFGPVSHGFDMKIGSKKAGQKAAEYIAKKYGSKVITSFKLAGVDSRGKEKKRFTFCVRIK